MLVGGCPARVNFGECSEVKRQVVEFNRSHSTREGLVGESRIPTAGEVIQYVVAKRHLFHCIRLFLALTLKRIVSSESVYLTSYMVRKPEIETGACGCWPR